MRQLGGWEKKPLNPKPETRNPKPNQRGSRRLGVSYSRLREEDKEKLDWEAFLALRRLQHSLKGSGSELITYGLSNLHENSQSWELRFSDKANHLVHHKPISACSLSKSFRTGRGRVYFAAWLRMCTSVDGGVNRVSFHAHTMYIYIYIYR